MNRRRFLELLGMVTVGSAVAYSFPNVIVPKNIIIPEFIPSFTTCNMGTAGPITYSMLLEAYKRIRENNFEPNVMKIRIPYSRSLYIDV